MPICEGCGYEYEQDEMAVLPVLVNLKDGTQRDVTLCGDICIDFWDDTAPGDWVALHSGEEVQRVHWMCDVCSSVWEHTGVKLLIDMDNFDPDDDTAGEPRLYARLHMEKTLKSRSNEGFASSIDDSGDPLENVKMAESIVCASCRKKEKDRFKTRADIGL